MGISGFEKVKQRYDCNSLGGGVKVRLILGGGLLGEGSLGNGLGRHGDTGIFLIRFGGAEK